MESWEELHDQCHRCYGCGLGHGQRTVAFGQGFVDAPILCVVHHPGGPGRLLSKEEEALLWDLLSLVGLDPQQVYMAAVVKCVPPQERGVLHLEEHTCLPWLRAQWKLMQPALIVCLGQGATSAIMGQEVLVSTHHGQWFARAGVDMMAMEHPGILLRHGDRRPEAFLDVQSLAQKARQAGILKIH